MKKYLKFCLVACQAMLLLAPAAHSEESTPGPIVLSDTQLEAVVAGYTDVGIRVSVGGPDGTKVNNELTVPADITPRFPTYDQVLFPGGCVELIDGTQCVLSIRYGNNGVIITDVAFYAR